MISHMNKSLFKPFEDAVSEFMLSLNININEIEIYNGNFSWSSEDNIVFKGFELVYVMQGEIVICINGKDTVIKSGGIYLLKPYSNYKVRVLGDQVIRVGRIEFNIEPYFKRREFCRLFFNEQQLPYFNRSYDYFEYVFKQLSLNNGEECEPGYFFLLKTSLAYTFVFAIKDLINNGFDFNAVQGVKMQESIVEKTIDYIEQHMNEPISIKNVAANLYLSENALYKAFINAVGESPQQFLLNYKIDKGDKMINHYNKSVTETAIALGFASTAHFSRTYKHVMGYSPKKGRGRPID